MYLLVASELDEAAETLRAHLPPGSARILTPADLSRTGWRIEARDPRNGRFVADGEHFSVTDLSGVVTLMPRVFPAELLRIREEARTYVAEEMTALLKYWLSSLPCRLLNPATAGCLGGPNWSIGHWLVLAKEAGLRHATRTQGTSRLEPAECAGTTTVTAIGDQVVEKCDAWVSERTRRLAALAGTPMLSVTYGVDEGGYSFVAAQTFPSLRETRAAQLIVEYFARG